MMYHIRISIIAMVIIIGAGSASPALAEEKSGFDKAWSYMTLYENKKNAALQKFALVGRAQLDAAWVDPDGQDADGNDLENWSDALWRRFRFGFEATLCNDWKAHLEADFDLNEDIDDWYTKLTDAYIQWQPNEDLKIKLFKQSAGFTLDGATSSKRLLALERNNLTNNLWFTREYFNGALVSGTSAGGFSYKASIFSSGGDPELDWDGASWFTFWQLGYQIGDTKLHVDYVYQDEDENANTSDFEQIISFVPQWQKGPWGIWGDLSFGKGFADLGQSDVWGFSVMPFYDVSTYTQIVARYTYVDGDGDNSVRLNKYDNKVVGDKGDQAQDLYLGFNIFFYSHKFKWQTGITLASMDDAADDGGEYEGITLSTGLRVYW